ncbi:pimeloyl-ACP methyl ester carboxylesterase [Bacillus mesophilus]|nr:pimeloyl-ACP methyl ester carboxylesterase [Bacillus mesophilus]
MKLTNYNSYGESIQGLVIYYEMHPTLSKVEQPTIVLIHGFLSSTFSFRRLIPLLVQNYNVIAIDFPPFGKSNKSRRFVYTYQNIASNIIELLEHHHIKKPILVGHSMGGQLCLHIIKQRPKLISKAILLCSSAYLERPKQSIRFSTYLPFFSLYLKHWLSKQGVKSNLLNVVYDPSMIDDEMMLGYEEPFTNKRIFPGLTRLIRHRESDLSPKDVQEIDTECLLIWGKQDRVVPVSIGKRLNKDLKNSKLIILEHTGHLLPEERPEEIYTYINQFVNPSRVVEE